VWTDADIPDPLLRMVSCMVHNKQIMDLCSETKIVNNVESQIHLALQCDIFTIWLKLSSPYSVVVTCLPDCFSICCIKAPKSDTVYRVPILTNLDIVEH